MIADCPFGCISPTKSADYSGRYNPPGSRRLAAAASPEAINSKCAIERLAIAETGR